MIRWCTVPKIWCATDRRRDRKSDTGGCPTQKLISWDIRLNNFGPNWAQILLLLEKGIFWENWLTLLFSIYCAPLCYNVSKKYWQIMRYKVLKFWAKLDTNHPLTPTRDFFKKADWYFCLLQIPHHNTAMFKKKSLKWITKYKAA